MINQWQAVPSHGRGPRFDPVSAHQPHEQIHEGNQSSPNVIPFRQRPSEDPDSAPIGTDRHRQTWTRRGPSSAYVPPAGRVTLPAEYTFIYYVRVADFIKIGQSRHWKRRVNNLNTASPFDVHVLLVEMEQPKREKFLHKKFRHLRHRGEWFRAEPELLAFIEKLVAEHHDLSCCASYEGW